MLFSKCASFNGKSHMCTCGTGYTLGDTDLNPRTIVEEQQHSKAQRGGGQQNQTDVAGDHEVAHHQGHLVLVPAVLIQRWWRGIMAPAHAPLQGPPPLQRRGEDGPRRAPRGAQGPVGKNDGGGVRAGVWGRGQNWTPKEICDGRHPQLRFQLCAVAGTRQLFL